MRIIRIKNCIECPCRKYSYMKKSFFCEIEKEIKSTKSPFLKDLNKIPLWCSLEETI